mmetsp:Transcript_5592/g.13503  ORF Transcript_5592/g.13503 Transcript_5592/m.13503 type:complete len:344 (-) Transcript_5592:1137-2168(-)
MANLGCRAFGHQNCVGGGAQTPFGNAFLAQSRTWTLALCQADSDGDGVSNGQEMGDPCCVWRVGEVPEVTDLGSLSLPTDGGSATTVKTNCSVEEGGSPDTGDTPPVFYPETEPEVMAHGVMMSLAFMTFYPLAFLFVRFVRMYFPNATTPGGISAKPAWFFFHMSINLLAIALVLAAYITLEVHLGVFLETKDAHAILGFIVVVLVFLQTTSALLARPAPDSPWRRTWYMVHVALASTIAGCGAANVILGIDRLGNRAKDSMYAVAGVWLGAVVLGGVMLEVFGRISSEGGAELLEKGEVDTDAKLEKEMPVMNKGAMVAAAVVAAVAVGCGVANSVMIGVN